MSHRTRAPLRFRGALILLSVLLFIVTLPHVAEDFSYGNLLGLNVAPSLALAALACAYALQSYGTLLAFQADNRGALLLAFAGATWSVGAIAVHGHDILFAGSGYRHGTISRAAELAIVILGGTLAVVGLRQGLKGR